MVSHSTLRPSALLSLFVALLFSTAFVAASAVEGVEHNLAGLERQRRVRSPAQATGIARRAVNYMAVRPRAHVEGVYARASASNSLGGMKTPSAPHPTGKPHGVTPNGSHPTTRPHASNSRSGHGPAPSRHPDVGGNHHPSGPNPAYPYNQPPQGPYGSSSSHRQASKSASRSGVYYLAHATSTAAAAEATA